VYSPWREIDRNIAHGIGTKKDTSPWFKNIYYSEPGISKRNNHEHNH